MKVTYHGEDNGNDLTFNVEIDYNEAENEYVATSKDIPGLVITSETFDHLVKDVSDTIHDLLSD